MRYKREENGDKFMILTKKEFDHDYVVGCIDLYDSAGGPDSEVRIKIYGEVPDMKHCVVRKDSTPLRNFPAEAESIYKDTSVLIDMLLEWWEHAQFEAGPPGYNRYTYPPDFVKKAMIMRPDHKHSGEDG